jgi:hypothetical protein
MWTWSIAKRFVPRPSVAPTMAPTTPPTREERDSMAYEDDIFIPAGPVPPWHPPPAHLISAADMAYDDSMAYEDIIIPAGPVQPSHSPPAHLIKAGPVPPSHLPPAHLISTNTSVKKAKKSMKKA